MELIIMKLSNLFEVSQPQNKNDLMHAMDEHRSSIEKLKNKLKSAQTSNSKASKLSASGNRDHNIEWIDTIPLVDSIVKAERRGRALLKKFDAYTSDDSMT